MNKISIILVALIFFMCFPMKVYAAWLPLTQDFSSNTVITIKKCSIYSEPNGKKIGTAYKGSCFTMIHDCGNWVFIADKDHNGFIKKKNLVFGDYFYDYLFQHQDTCKYAVKYYKASGIPYYKDKKCTKQLGVVPIAIATSFTYEWTKIKIGNKSYYISNDGIELIPIYKSATWRNY